MPTTKRSISRLLFVSGGLVCSLGLVTRGGSKLSILGIDRWILWFGVFLLALSRFIRPSGPAKGEGEGGNAGAAAGVWDGELDAPH